MPKTGVHTDSILLLHEFAPLWSRERTAYVQVLQILVLLLLYRRTSNHCSTHSIEAGPSYPTTLGPSAEWYLKSLADVACSSGFVDRGVWLRVAKQLLSCALVRGRGVVFRHYYKSIAKCAGKDYRDGPVVPFE